MAPPEKRMEKEGDSYSMQPNVLPRGTLVYISSYGPLRGLRGTIQGVDIFEDELKGTFCFYLVALQGEASAEPMWFESEEVGVVTPLAVAPRGDV